MATIRLLATLLATLLVVIATAACSGAGPAGPQLAGHDYLSVAITENGAPKTLVAGTRIRLGFEGTRISAHAGCNSMGGEYRIDGGRLLVSDLAMTAMGCDQPLHEQDAWLASFLGSGPQLRLSGNDLTLEGGGIVLRLLDREVAEPDVDLVGQTWTLESIIAGDTVSSVPVGIEATLVFRDGGNLGVNAGCNRGGGTWRAVDGGIEVGPLMLTKMACQRDGAFVEGAVLGVLESGTVAVAIDGPLLTLQAGGRGLQYRAR